MHFELTASLLNAILFAMEDQTTKRLVDARKGVLVLEEESSGTVADEEFLYALPEWTSNDGFTMRSGFVENLHSPLAREELRLVLESGRGVFRNFKNVLKAYPEVERRWNLYKNKYMGHCIKEWYAALRESWGLEKLEDTSYGSEVETDEILNADFEFMTYDSVRDKEDVENGKRLLTEEYERQFQGELGKAVGDLWLSFSNRQTDKAGFLCRTQTGEFIGCILFSFCPSSAKKTVAITDFFVVQDYRGLGIGKELFSMCLASLKEHGIQWTLLGNFIIPPAMEQMLTQWGFEHLGSGYVADLFKE